MSQVTKQQSPIKALTGKHHSSFDVFLNVAKALVQRDGADAVIALDTETNAEDIRDGRGYLTCITMALSLTGSDYHTVFIPINMIDAENNVSSDRVEQLKDFLENFPGWLVFHNAKFDIVSLTTTGISYAGRFYCTMLMAHLVNENYPFSKDLTSCVKHYVDKEESKKDSPGFKWLTENIGWGNITSAVMHEYAEHDPLITLKLFQKLLPKFNKEVTKEYWEHKQKFLRVIIAMERRGITIDSALCGVMAAQGEAELERIRKELHGFNPGSGKDLQSLLIDKLKLPVVKRSAKTNAPSFDKEAMEQYDEMLAEEDNETARLVFHYRGWQKTVSSNYKAYLELVSEDGRLRPNYKLHGTKTGRLSCSKPNLQQIPRSSEKPWNGNLKAAFIPDSGYELWEFDYSQLELRLATAYADEKELKKVFEEGRDIFTEMSEILGMTRQATKVFVYSTQYGAGLTRLMHVFKIGPEAAEKMKRNYQNRFPGFVKVATKASSMCKATGRVQLWSGRYRHFWDKREDAHKAFNSAIQGGSADIVEHVMVRLFEEIDDEEDCRMLLTVHDSVVFEIKSDLVGIYKLLIEEIMTDVRPDFGVTFAVEGKKWGSK